MAKTWGIPGKRQTYLSPGEQISRKPKVPLNSNPLEPWDSKKSKFQRIDLVPKPVSEDAQQAGVVSSTTPAPSATPNPTPSITPSITPTITNTPTKTATPTVTPTEPYDVYQFEECNNPLNIFRYENVPGLLTTGTTYQIVGGSGFNGYATVVNYTGAGTLYPSTGVTFTPSVCPSPTPTPTVTQTNTPSVTPSITPSVTATCPVQSDSILIAGRGGDTSFFIDSYDSTGNTFNQLCDSVVEFELYLNNGSQISYSNIFSAGTNYADFDLTSVLSGNSLTALTWNSLTTTGSCCGNVSYQNRYRIENCTNASDKRTASIPDSWSGSTIKTDAPSNICFDVISPIRISTGFPNFYEWNFTGILYNDCIDCLPPTPTPTATITQTPTASETPTNTPTETPSPTPTPSGAAAGNLLLQEDGGELLQEDGGQILLEQ